MRHPLLLLLPAALLPLSFADEAAPAPPALEAWAQYLLRQTEPENYWKGCGYLLEPDAWLSPEEESECNAAREGVQKAIAAAGGLYRVRAELLCHLRHSNGSFDEQAGVPRELPEAYAAALRECLMHDLRGLAACAGWVDAYDTFLLPGHEGRQLLRHLPAPLESIYRQAYGCTAENGELAGVITEQWEAAVHRFLHEYRNCYGEDTEAPAYNQCRSPFTRELRADDFPLSHGQGGITELARRHRAAIFALFDREEAAWKQYAEAMEAIVCPTISYSGSGDGIRQSELRRHLLDSRMRWCCLLAEGSGDEEEPAPQLAAEDRGLLPLHPGHAYGDIFEEEAHICRHPALEGQPWCIRFPYADAGFILVKEGEVFKRYLAAAPEGGKLRVRGYQSIEAGGEPEAGAFTLRQLFILLEARPRAAQPSIAGLMDRECLAIHQYMAACRQALQQADDEHEAAKDNEKRLEQRQLQALAAVSTKELPDDFRNYLEYSYDGALTALHEREPLLRQLDALPAPDQGGGDKAGGPRAELLRQLGEIEALRQHRQQVWNEYYPLAASLFPMQEPCKPYRVQAAEVLTADDARRELEHAATLTNGQPSRGEGQQLPQQP